VRERQEQQEPCDIHFLQHYFNQLFCSDSYHFFVMQQISVCLDGIGDTYRQILSTVILFLVTCISVCLPSFLGFKENKRVISFLNSISLGFTFGSFFFHQLPHMFPDLFKNFIGENILKLLFPHVLHDHHHSLDHASHFGHSDHHSDHDHSHPQSYHEHDHHHDVSTLKKPMISKKRNINHLLAIRKKSQLLKKSKRDAKNKPAIPFMAILFSYYSSFLFTFLWTGLSFWGSSKLHDHGPDSKHSHGHSHSHDDNSETNINLLQFFSPYFFESVMEGASLVVSRSVPQYISYLISLLMHKFIESIFAVGIRLRGKKSTMMVMWYGFIYACIPYIGNSILFIKWFVYFCYRVSFYIFFEEFTS
jgi:zinc transporter ZupT